MLKNVNEAYETLEATKANLEKATLVFVMEARSAYKARLILLSVSSKGRM